MQWAWQKIKEHPACVLKSKSLRNNKFYFLGLIARYFAMWGNNNRAVIKLIWRKRRGGISLAHIYVHHHLYETRGGFVICLLSPHRENLSLSYPLWWLRWILINLGTSECMP